MKHGSTDIVSSLDKLLFGMYQAQVKFKQPAPFSQLLLFAHVATINIAEKHGLRGGQTWIQSGSYHPDVNTMAITTIGLI